MSHVYILRGYDTAEKRAIESLLTQDDSNLVCSAIGHPCTREDAMSSRRVQFLRLICAKAPVIVVSDYLKTRDECDEFIESAIAQDYQVTSIVVEALSRNPRSGYGPKYAQAFEIQLHPETGVQKTQIESPPY